MKKLSLLLLTCLSILCSQGQKRVLNYPFQFEKSFLAKGDYDAFFLDNPTDSAFALILKDNRKVEYVWLSKDFKVLSKVPAPIGNTVLDQSNHHYIGGTAVGGEYHFIYHIKSGYQQETVNFNGQSVNNKKLLELPKSEKSLVSFSDNDAFYIVCADDKSGELIFHIVNAKGDLNQKNIPFTIPAEVSKNRNKLSTYLGEMKVIKSKEEPDLSSAVHSAKLVSQPGVIRFVVNDGDNPTHIFSVDLSDFSTLEKKIDYGDLIARNDKGKVYISSFLRDSTLYSLILNKKSIRIAVHNLFTGVLQNKFEFTEESGTNLFSELPVTEKRLGKKVDLKDVDDVKKLIKAFTKGTEGLMVTRTESGKLVLTAGTYDNIQISSGGSSGGYTGGWKQGGATIPVTPGIVNHGATYTSISTWDSYMYYRPGNPGFTTTSARYYTTTHFKLLLDPETFKVSKGRVPTSVADQVKDYIDDTNKKAKATNQFNIGKSQYYGYYDKDSQAYVVEQIRIIR